MSTAIAPCDHRGHPSCQIFRPGHNLHVIHANQIGRRPWGWRDAVVTDVVGPTITLSYVGSGATVVLWHHLELGARLAAGEPVRVNEEYHALGLPAGWFNVVVVAGAGAVPPPQDADRWRDRMTAGVVDNSTGTGLAMDHLEP